MATLGMTEAEREAIERFQKDVVDPSQTSLVILDFWAPWCGPCKQLTPLLEKVAADYADRGVVLVKINVDEDKMIAAQFRIQSIPTVYAFFQGQPVADISTYRSESQLKQALDHLLAQLPVAGSQPPQAEIGPLLEMGEEILSSGDAERAVSIFRQVQDMAPEDPAVAGALARALLAAGDPDGAKAALEAVEEKNSDHPAVARARAALALAAAPKDESEIGALREAVEKAPDDHQARLTLAEALAAGGDRDSAADQLLDSIARDRDWNDGIVRKRFLQLLEAQGLEDPWARAQRRRLSALLFT